MHRFAFLLLSLLSGVSGAFADDRNTSYTFTQLNAPFPGVDQTLGSGINDFGWVVGNYHDSTGDHGFVLNRGVYTSIDVPFSGASDTIAFGINLRGAFGINLRGEIVGRYDETSGGTVTGFVLKQGRFTPLVVPFPSVNTTIPRGINDNDQIVGLYFDSTGSHGFIFERGKFSSLDVPFWGAHDTAALGINNRGEVVGGYTGSDGLIHGFIEQRGFFRRLDVPGATETLWYGINNRGEIVGNDQIFKRGVFISFRVSLPNVNSTVASGVNDFGQIVGIYGTSQTDGQEFGFLATPSYSENNMAQAD
jgi:hypothetical protein